MEKVALLTELKALADDVPDFGVYAPMSKIHLVWLGRAHALLNRWNRVEAMGFSSAADLLHFAITRDSNIAKLLGTLHRAIADLEIEVPALPSQAFGPGAVYDFLRTLRDLLASASKSVFVIDPYLDETVFDAYVSVIPAPVTVRLLAREYTAALKPALMKFVAQKKMPIEIRSSKAIHDRVLFLDDNSCWVLGTSIKDAAKSRPTYLAPLSADAALLKKADYERIWQAAPIV